MRLNILDTRALLLVGLLAAASVSASAQKDLKISEIQGSGNMSPVVGESVRTTGVVTARTRTGFFVQTPDDKVDKDPATSEGIFVYTRSDPPAEAAVGALVSVSGTVEEFRPRSQAATLSLTEISMQKGRDELKVISGREPLPKPYGLTAADFRSNQIDQLERFEGMRVTIAEMTATAPTEGRVDIKTASSVSDGTFFGVVKGLPRPFREPGMDINEITFLEPKDKQKLQAEFPKLQIFDANPQRIRVESTAQPGSLAINVPAFSDIKNLTGVLHYSYRAYTLFVDPDNKPTLTSALKANRLPAPSDRQFAIAGMNLENFFDDQDDPDIREDIVTPDGFKRRLKKISAAIRDVMQMPDVIGVVEVENISALKRLAERINSDAVAAGKTDPKYDAYVIEGNDGRGIDCGFLVKSTRVKMIEVKQFGKDDKYKNPNTKEDNFLNDRPPLMLRASINDPKTGTPFEFTVVVNHLKSFLGYDDPKQQDNVRLKKRLQAEMLANFVQARQKADPAQRIILIGDFNAFQFNDGVMDVIGTIIGRPAPADEVLFPSPDLVDRDMADLVTSIDQQQRYSYSYDGNAQAIDHMLINEPMQGHIVGFGFARLNADWCEIYRNDESRPERFSDHDPAVGYFTFDTRAVAKQ